MTTRHVGERSSWDHGGVTAAPGPRPGATRYQPPQDARTVAFCLEESGWRHRLHSERLGARPRMLGICAIRLKELSLRYVRVCVCLCESVSININLLAHKVIVHWPTAQK